MNIKELNEKLAILEEETLEEKKKKAKKKPYDSVTYTTGDIQKNIDHFNKMLSGKAENNHTDGYLNGSWDQPKAATPDGASCIDTGASVGGDAGGDAGGGMGESLELDEAQIFAAKAGMYIDLPKEISPLSPKMVEDAIRKLSPEELFTVGYVTPVFFYKKLNDKFTLVKCTELTGYTGEDYRTASVEDTQIQKQLRIAQAQNQIKDPTGHTDYNVAGVNTENNKVKSRVTGMQKEYGDINKTVKQADIDIFEIDPSTGKVLKDANGKPVVKETVKELKTILFFPLKGSKPKVRYYIDLKDGKGFREIPRNILVDIIYNKVREITARDVNSGAIRPDEDLTDTELEFLGNVKNKVEAVIANDEKTIEDVVLSTGSHSYDGSMTKPSVRSLYTNQIYFLDTPKETLGAALFENLTEAKRYVRRYYVKPQNIFCSNKDEVLKALIDHEDEDCVVYTLIRLGDVKDVSKLNSGDIIYYYEDGILYDKNHVRIMDYELSIKHEEERPHINPETTSDAKFADIYQDRMTGVSELEEAFALTFDNIDAFGTKLIEGAEKHKCCICGDEFVGYGNNPEPYMTADNDERCCDACNIHFVIPARIAQMSEKEEK